MNALYIIINAKIIIILRLQMKLRQEKIAEKILKQGEMKIIHNAFRIKLTH
jgi:hypothetical protein